MAFLLQSAICSALLKLFLAAPKRSTKPRPQGKKHNHDPQHPKLPAAAIKTAPRGKSWARLEQALRVTDLLLQAGGFSCIVLDMGSLNAEYALRVPLATWFRFRTAAERLQSNVLLLTQHACSRNSAGLVLRLEPGSVLAPDSTIFTGLEHRAELARQRFPQSPGNVFPLRSTAGAGQEAATKRTNSAVAGQSPLGRPLMTERYACVDVKEFPLQALLRLRPELQSKPVAVLDGEPPFEQVCSLNSAARTLGIALGMTRLEMEMFPTALVLPRSRAEEAAARAALLECAGGFSPRVEDQSSDSYFTCVIDIAGTETLFGSPDALGERLLKKTQALCIRASIAISSNFHAARCLARGHSSGKCAGIRVVPRGMECAALAPLPLTVLDLSPEHAETFAMWGITTLGALANLQETELIARLGQPGKEMRLLARGESPHLFRAIEASLALEERMELDSPVELLDSLLFILGVMLDQLIVRAQSRILALASITLHLDLEGSTDAYPHGAARTAE